MKKIVYSKFNELESKVENLEEEVLKLQNKIESLIDVQRNHLIRIKNKEELSDEFVLSGKRYQDLSPDKSWKIYNDKNFDFIFIDVSSKDYSPLKEIPEVTHIPWEEFKDRFLEIQSKTIPLFIISEDGTKSILACEFLVKRGFYNCNNISGGYQYWKGIRGVEAKDLIA